MSITVWWMSTHAVLTEGCFLYPRDTVLTEGCLLYSCELSGERAEWKQTWEKRKVGVRYEHSQRTLCDILKELIKLVLKYTKFWKYSRNCVECSGHKNINVWEPLSLQNIGVVKLNNCTDKLILKNVVAVRDANIEEGARGPPPTKIKLKSRAKGY